MKGKHIKLLREHTHISQAEMAQILEVSSRTIAKWESDEYNMIPRVYTEACRIGFENLVLSPLLRECTSKIFKKIPSEFIGIWLVRYSLFPLQYSQEKIKGSPNQRNFLEVILHENTSRYQCLCNSKDEKNKCYWKDFCNGNYFFNNDRIHKNMNQISQTIYPLQSGLTINLTEDDVVKSPYKRFPGRTNLSYHDKQCHSLLHVPYHLPGATGPQPIALVSLENKLIKDDNGQWIVKTFSEGVTESAFTKEDEEIAKDLIKIIYKETLQDIIEAFDYIIPSSE